MNDLLPLGQLMWKRSETLNTGVDVNHGHVGAGMCLHDHILQVCHVRATAEDAGDQDDGFVGLCGSGGEG